MDEYDVLIVGAGHGGAQVAILLRQHGFDGRIALVGAEPELPYERPPLSKDYLAGEKTFERMLIRPAAFWADRQIDLFPGTGITAVDPGARIATSAAGRQFAYRNLVWAAGGVPRRLACEGADLAGVHLVRNRADVDAIRSELGSSSRAVIIGGGYIGLEAAAILNRLGKQVLLVEALDRVLARVAGPELSRFFEAQHRARGVEIRLSETVARVEGDGRAEAVQLAGGDRIEADLVVTGIGIEPAVGPLLAAGAEGADGVDIDENCRTSLTAIFAIGDCAAHRNRYGDGRRLRIESVQNAHDQAAAAVRSILGRPEPFSEIPWFWSIQYELRLQTVGLSVGYDETIVRGSADQPGWSLIYLRQGRVVALDCVNATRAYVQGRKLIAAGRGFDSARLADMSVPLKDLV